MISQDNRWDHQLTDADKIRRWRTVDALQGISWADEPARDGGMPNKLPPSNRVNPDIPPQKFPIIRTVKNEGDVVISTIPKEATNGR